MLSFVVSEFLIEAIGCSSGRRERVRTSSNDKVERAQCFQKSGYKFEHYRAGTYKSLAIDQGRDGMNAETVIKGELLTEQKKKASGDWPL